MKRLLLLLALIVAMWSLVTGAPTVYKAFSNIGEVTVDSQYSATIWDALGSVPYAADDTSTIDICVSGVAVMGHRDVLYLGLSEDTASGGMELDTVQIQPRINPGRGLVRIPFCYHYVWTDTVSGGGGGTAYIDTVYLYGAVGGSTNIEKVQLEDLMVTVDINEHE